MYMVINHTKKEFFAILEQENCPLSKLFEKYKWELNNI
jgi:hypothetical protein